MPAKAAEKLSDEALEREMQALQAEIHTAGEKLQELADVRDHRAAKAQAERVIEGMSPGERDAVVKAVAASVKTEGKAPGGDA